MVLQLNKDALSDQTERYRNTGLTPEFLGDMAKVVAALNATGYEPYDQLTGSVMTDNDQYITRFGGARAIVTKMDMKDIRIFLKHYKDHK